MNSFRVVDTRFRILKGGKIGLAASIALIGGMLTLGSTSANATDYFNSAAIINNNYYAYGGGENEYLYADSGYNTSSSTTATHADTSLTNDVVFTPNL